MKLHGHLGGLYAEIAGARQPWSWEDNVHNWSATLHVLAGADSKRTLLSKLSTPQASSLALLEEWWHSEPSVDCRSCRIWIDNPEGPVPRVHDSEYHRRLFDLWSREFGTYKLPDYQNGKHLQDLALVRQHAAEVAAAHRTSTSALADMRPQGTSATAEAAGPDNPPISAFLQACPWLDERNAKDGYPYFLWDRRNRKTVHLPEQSPEYMVVSHTWGRWRTKTWCNRSARVKGVPGWKVPCNSIFDVRRLPDILADIPFGPRYVWLDLVCIPQDDSPLGRREISRQAAIFSSAKLSVIWFNRVPSWDGMVSVVNWLSIKYLKQNEPPISDITSLEPRVAADAETETGLAGPSQASPDNPHTLRFLVRDRESTGSLEPDGWFTSLWTLQEACLRPDMFVCDAEWRPLSTSKKSRAIPLDHFVALFNLVLNDNPAGELLPPAVHEIAGIFLRTALHKLLTMSMSDVITMGNQRYCGDNNRAVAIMSALGVTEWFDTDKNWNKGGYESFVEKKYPLQFVQEVHRKCGALLFATADLTRLALDNYVFDDAGGGGGTGRITDTCVRATMLPFSSEARRQRFALTDDVGVEDHPAVRDWAVAADGSVRISRASIVASWPRDTSAHRHEHGVFADIAANPPGEYVKGSFDLDQWLGSFRPRSEKYALCLFRKFAKTYYGVILERIYLWPNQMDFAKIGTFWFNTETDSGHVNGNFRFFGSTEVVWRVL